MSGDDYEGVSISFSPLACADGSAKFHLGKSSTLASVNGPDQILQHKEIIDQALVEVHYEPKSGQSSCADRQIESFIRQLCDQTIITTMYPRTSLLINVTELHDDGCLLASAINCTVLALCDAGIPLKRLVAAATCCVDTNGLIVMDPSKEDNSNSCAIVSAVIENETNQILSIHSKGTLNNEKLNECITAITKRCNGLFAIFRSHLAER